MVDEGEKGWRSVIGFAPSQVHTLLNHQSSFSMSKFLAHRSLDIYGSIQIDVWTKSVYTAN